MCVCVYMIWTSTIYICIQIQEHKCPTMNSLVLYVTIIMFMGLSHRKIRFKSHFKLNLMRFAWDIAHPHTHTHTHVERERREKMQDCKMISNEENETKSVRCCCYLFQCHNYCYNHMQRLTYYRSLLLK